MRFDRLSTVTNHEARHDGDVKPLLATICRPHVLTRDAWQLCGGPHDDSDGNSLVSKWSVTLLALVMLDIMSIALSFCVQHSGKAQKVFVDDVNAHVKGCINEVEERRNHIRAKLEDEVRLLQLKSRAEKVRSICFYPTCYWGAGFK